MRIAHVTATFPPYRAGTGAVAFHNARVLHDRGHRVEVFTAGPRGREEAPFPVHRLPAILRLGNAPLTPGLVHRLRGFDLIHLHHPYIFGAELTLAAARVHGVPFVLTYHNRLEDSRPVKRALFAGYGSTAEPLLLHAARRVLAVRREHLDAVQPGLAGSPRVRELVNGVDGTTFAPQDRGRARAGLGLDPSAPVAAFVGALDSAHRFKNVDGLLRAFSRVRLPGARLLIAGDGDLRPTLQRLAGDLGLASRVRFLGAWVPDALPALYAAADVTVLPSTGVESFGLVLIEALACGCPVVVPDLPGVRDVLKGSDAGLLVDARDESALAAALVRALEARESLRQRALGSREALLDRYEWVSVGKGLEAIYAEVLDPVRQAAMA